MSVSHSSHCCYAGPQSRHLSTWLLQLPSVWSSSKKFSTNDSLSRTLRHHHQVSIHLSHSVLKDLYWLPMRYRIQYKILIHTFKAIHNLAPPHLSDLLHITTAPSDVHLFSTSLFLLFNSLLWGGFSHSSPKIWNSLPPDLRNINSLPHFKSNLKTHLFRLSKESLNRHWRKAWTDICTVNATSFVQV